MSIRDWLWGVQESWAVCEQAEGRTSTGESSGAANSLEAEEPGRRPERGSGRRGGCPDASGALLDTRPPFLLPQAVGPGGVAGPVQIVNNKFLAWSGVMEWQEVSLG